MSGPPFVTLDEFDGSQGFVKTKGFVNWEIDLRSHKPRQKVMLGDNEVGTMRPCVVYAEDIHLEKGCGYTFGGIDRVYEPGEEIQLYLSENSWADKFYDPNE